MIVDSITITRETVFKRYALRPLSSFSYSAVGPDGRRWGGDGIADMRQRLRRAYPGITLIEAWKKEVAK